MANYLIKDFYIGINDVDANLALSPRAALLLLQDVATEHAKDCGFGWDAMHGAGKFWVLTKIKVFFVKPVKAYQTVSVETWPLEPGRLYAERDFVVRNKDGNVIIIATSRWCVVDFNSRKLAKPSDIEHLTCITYRTDRAKDASGLNGVDITTNAEKAPSILIPSKIVPTSPTNASATTDIVKAPTIYSTESTLKSNPLEFARIALDDTFKKSYSITTRWTDIDVNNHVNNTRYADFAINALSLETISKAELQEFEVNYSHELKINQTVDIVLSASDNTYKTIGTKDGITAFSACFKFKN